MQTSKQQWTEYTDGTPMRVNVPSGNCSQHKYIDVDEVTTVTLFSPIKRIKYKKKKPKK